MGERADALWSSETRLWLEGVESYDELVAENCLMVFPGIGALDRREAIEGLRQAPRWSSVDLHERKSSRPADDVAVLAYLAEGRRAEAEPYRAFCSSTYSRGTRGWQLIQHQQTVAD